MHSIQIQSMLTGYTNHAAELGYQNNGALPLSEAETQALLGSMYHTQTRMTCPCELLLLLRDGLLFSLLWQTCFRRFNAGGLRLGNITLPTGAIAVFYLVPTMKLPNGVQLLLDTTNSQTPPTPVCNSQIAPAILLLPHATALVAQALHCRPA